MSIFFRNFATKVANLLRLGKKKKQVSLFCSRLSVTLSPIGATAASAMLRCHFSEVLVPHKAPLGAA